MKNTLLATLTLYQKIISPLFHQLFGGTTGCRYTPTCSEYSKEVIERYGLGKGLLLSMRRVLSCQPFFSL